MKRKVVSPNGVVIEKVRSAPASSRTSITS
jgi:hypothetical protein